MVRVSKLAGSDSFALGRYAVRLTARQHLPPAAEIVCGTPALRHPAGLMAGLDYHAVAHPTSTLSPTRPRPARRGALAVDRTPRVGVPYSVHMYHNTVQHQRFSAARYRFR